MLRVLGVLAGVLAWLGWFTVCPALGLPTLGTAAMLNRVVAPREDPGFWLGWALLLIALGSVALLYLVAADRGRMRPSIASGAVFGVICWLLAGAVVMPLLEFALPAAPTTPAAPALPDPMRPSFMMLHLGMAAPIAALVAWLMFGAVLGAVSGARASDPSVPNETRTLRAILFGAAAAIVALFALGLVADLSDITQAAPSPTSSRTLATGPAAALPEGASFFSIVELPQAAGATFGPHAHFPGFAYSLSGVSTLSFGDGRQIRIGPGDAGFMGTQELHSHVNADDRLPAGALTVLIVALATMVCLISLSAVRGGGRLLMVACVLLIAAGALGTWNPWSNDWLFLAVRPSATRLAPMPLPTASRTYESPDLGALPPGPYVETLDEIVIAPDAVAADLGSAGAAVLLVLEGRVEVQPASGSPIQVGARGATLLQLGTSVRGTGDPPARLLKFAVTPASEPTANPSVVVVPATANIFGAGQDTAPAPGGGGGGTVPPVWPLPSGATRIVTFPSVTGEVNPIANFESVGSNGPGGDMTSDTDVESYGGISGIVHHANGMFLVGLFLTDDPPADPAPARLDFTDNEDFDLLEPEIGQTFFIGDGGGRRYLVPPGATRLFLGFVNAYIPGDPLRLTHGEPGYYDNNAGELEVTIEVSIE